MLTASGTTEDSMATTISTLAAKLILDNGKFLSGFKQSGKAAKGFNLELNESAIGLGRLGKITLPPSLGIGLAAAGTAAAALAAEAAIAAAVVWTLHRRMVDLDKQAKTARRLGLGFGEVQKLGIAARASGSDLDSLSKAMLKMGREIGTGKGSLADRFLQVANQIAKIEDPAERSARAIKVFGKGGDDLLTLLMTGSSGIMRSAAAIDRFGLALDDMDAKKIEAANDAIGVLTEVWTAFLNKAAVQAAPVFEETANAILNAAEKMSASFKELGADWALVGDVFQAVGIIITQVTSQLQASIDLLVVFVKTAQVLGQVLKDIKTGDIFLGESKEFTQAFKELQGQIDKFGESARLAAGVAAAEFNKRVAEAREGIGKTVMPGGDGGLSGGAIGKPVKPGPFERNSVEAVRAVQKAGGDGISAVNRNLEHALRYLKSIDANLDPNKAANPDALVLREGAI